MSGSDAGRALLVVIIWGLNFVVIDRGLKTLPPLLFVALRYVFTALPAVFSSHVQARAGTGSWASACR